MQIFQLWSITLKRAITEHDVYLIGIFWQINGQISLSTEMFIEIFDLVRV